MELGALVCTAAGPRCGDCPVARECAWLAAGRPAPATGWEAAGRPGWLDDRGGGAAGAAAWPGRPGGGRRSTRAPTGSAGAACSRCCARPAIRCAGPTSTRFWAGQAQLDRALDGLVADGLVDPLPDGRFALPGSAPLFWGAMTCYDTETADKETS